MKQAKTLIEKEFHIDLKLYDLSKELNHYILKNRANGKKYSCSCCGRLLKGNESNCPNCNAKFHSVQNITEFSTTYRTFTTVSNLDNYLLTRTYFVQNYFCFNKPSTTQITEMYRYMYNENGESIYARRNLTSYCYSSDFNINTPIKHRKDKSPLEYYTHKAFILSKPNWLKYNDLSFDVSKSKGKTFFELSSAREVYSKSISKPTYNKYIEALIKNKNLFETLEKIKGYEAMLCFMNKKQTYYEVFYRLSRKHLNIKGKMYKHYLNYIDNLVELKKDLTNLQIIFPPKLTLEEMEKAQNAVEKQRAKLERLKAIEEAKEKVRQNIVYIERNSKLFNLNLGNEHYNIILLKDVEDFAKTAVKLKNCVFRLAYYNSENSYIFKVLDKVTNQIVELCEIKKQDNELKISQCYGKCNKVTEQHDNIVNLINQNMYLLRRQVLSC